MPRGKQPGNAALVELRAFGLAYPGAHTKSPWPGHLDLAVNDKTFAYLSLEGEPFHISCKLPRSSPIALMLPFVKPAAYGLGKSGWVAASPPADQPIPVDLFKEWIDESYRAQAPKRLVAQLDKAGGAAAEASTRPGAAPKRAPVEKRTAARGAGKAAGRAAGKAAGRAAGKAAGRAAGKAAGRAAGKPAGRAAGGGRPRTASKPARR
jgi:predicted DNA-binding protein (MmcQ/YjbR family)